MTAGKTSIIFHCYMSGLVDIYHLNCSLRVRVCAARKALPLGCQSGRSVWRCCSQCKSSEKETHTSTLGLPLDPAQLP